MPATIRPLDPRDAPVLAALADRLFRETYHATHASMLDAYCAGAFGPAIQARELAEPGAAALLLEIDGEAAGYAFLRRRAVPPDMPLDAPLDGEVMEISRFYVDRRWHGAGMAARLMAGAREHAARAGAAWLWLQVWGENARAIAFYQKHGFRRVGGAWFDFAGLREEDWLMAVRPAAVRPAAVRPAAVRPAAGDA